MDTKAYIEKIAFSLREYQRENNIKKQPMSNAQYLYDSIIANQLCKVKVKAILIFAENNEEETRSIIRSHLVIELYDGTIIDPTYETYCLENKSYFQNVKDFIDLINKKTKLREQIDINKIIRNYIEYIKTAELINNGVYVVNSGDHYHKQADYLEKLYLK